MEQNRILFFIRSVLLFACKSFYFKIIYSLRILHKHDNAMRAALPAFWLASFVSVSDRRQEREQGYGKRSGHVAG